MKDQLNRHIDIAGIPKRIISLVPSQTELLVDLGLESSIVGVTKFCVHPEHLVKNKAIVGGTKQVHVDKIKALNPDIILCNKEENTKEMISELERIAIVHISDIQNIEDALELITMYGDLFEVSKQAKILCQSIEIEEKAFKVFLEHKEPLNVAYFIWKKPWMVAATDTFIDSLLSLNKFENHFSEQCRYPEIELDHISEELDLILLSSEPYPFKEEDVIVFSERFPHVKTLIVDGEYFSWFGSRIKNAFPYFKNLHQHIDGL